MTGRFTEFAAAGLHRGSQVRRSSWYVLDALAAASKLLDNKGPIGISPELFPAILSNETGVNSTSPLTPIENSYFVRFARAII